MILGQSRLAARDTRSRNIEIAVERERLVASDTRNARELSEKGHKRMDRYHPKVGSVEGWERFSMSNEKTNMYFLQRKVIYC